MSHPELTEREIERVLAGHQPPGRPDLAEVAFLIARLRTMGDFEQAPPMSPRLLAELDASEVVFRDDPVPPRTRVQRQRTRVMRRRWQLVGAVAGVAVVAGVLVAGAQGGDDRQRTEIDAQRTDATEAAAPTSAPETTTTTVPTTTTAPPTTQPSTTTTAATVPPPPVETTEAAPEGTPPIPWPGWPDMTGLDHETMEAIAEYCERNPGDEFCESYGPSYDRDGPYDDHGDRRPG
jgi:hypothetical protein